MSIGYSQFPAWITTNSSNSGNQVKTAGARTNNTSASVERVSNSSKQQVEQGAAGLMKQIFSAKDTNAAANTPKHETKVDKENTLGLPVVVEIDNVQVRTNNRTDEEVIKELSLKTCRSTMEIESELRRKYSNKVGTSLNMNA
jgi:hypothetical protein